MALAPISLPPGIFRNGTQYQAKGHWYDCNLVRFYQDNILPVGGWRSKSSAAITGKGRAIISWHDNSGGTWAATGTEQKLYAMTRGGTISDITPVGFTAGRADALAAGGYGSGTYGSGTYGSPRADASTVQEASIWTLDTFGERLNGCMAEDGIIYEWSLNPASKAVAVTNAPTATSIFVTNEGMLVALGAAGIPRRVQWSDQRNNTVWTASATNQAGDLDLQTNGTLLQGLRTNGSHLIFTDVDLWTMTYVPNNSVYSFAKAGNGCGAISRAAAITLDNQAVWMGKTGFWLYNGYVAELPCDVWNGVFSNLNIQQSSKITCEMNAQFGEVTWHFPSASSIEIDSYVTWNFRENHWSVGYISRFAGTDSGIFQYPLRIAGDGYVYEHEVGFSYDGALPYLEGGPIELGNGDGIANIVRLVPDDQTLGDVSMTIFTKMAPDDAETSHGPYTLAAFTDLRICARQLRVRFDGVNDTSWRIGKPRMDLTLGSKR